MKLRTRISLFWQIKQSQQTNKSTGQFFSLSKVTYIEPSVADFQNFPYLWVCMCMCLHVKERKRVIGQWNNNKPKEYVHSPLIKRTFWNTTRNNNKTPSNEFTPFLDYYLSWCSYKWIKVILVKSLARKT